MGSFLAKAIVIALSACAACSGAGMQSYTPVHEQTKMSADSLFDASREAAEELGYVAVLPDSEASEFDTREKEVAVSSIPRLSYKYSFHIATKGGLLSIEAKCTKNSATSEGKFDDCGDDRPERVIAEQKKLRARILELAPAIESKNPDWKTFENPPPEEDEKLSKEGGDKDKKGKAAPSKKADGAEKPKDASEGKDAKASAKEGSKAAK